MKAAFLYRFASYVEWPDDVPREPFVIAIAGGEDVASQLEDLLPRVKLAAGTAQVRRITRTSELEGVHILYISSQALARTRALRSAAAKLPILLVTDDEKGFDSGGVINFVEGSRNVRFEVSLVAADRARLKIDSALLSVAMRVERRPQGWMPCNPRKGCLLRFAAAPARMPR